MTKEEVTEVKIKMLKLGMNQTALAMRLGVTKQYISLLFNGASVPALEKRVKEYFENK